MSELYAPLVLLFVCSAFTSYVATAIVRRGAERVGLVDLPGERKHHAVATPRLGGLAIIFGFGFPLLLLAANSRAFDLVTKNLTYLFAVLASGALTIGLGVYDDLVGTNAPKKFAVQFAAAFILVAFGFHFDFISIGGRTFNLGILGIVASIIWIVGVMNAMNFIDGMDSLATVVALTIAAAFSVIAVLRFDAFSLVIMSALTGSLVGFYPWNKPPAKIFMGDTGALFIGLLLAAGSIAKPSKSPTALAIGGPMLALALPVLDTLLVMNQRLRGKNQKVGSRLSRVFTADRNHIHHILVARYGSTAKAIVGIWGITMLFAVAAVLTVLPHTKVIGYTMGGLALLALLVLRFLPKRTPRT
ncbi:MAG: undecaprenyl/decaprenyl-phosphate alpha-N-acetylglucosaminyl 1-phosphate transferase [Acidobacteriota bacterium]|nr:undecaprenyl/decaprenyl-phosphate alpha-N-acetylglucosaminyl 1-phosphate transferase [Acidobacteriota bacterium]